MYKIKDRFKAHIAKYAFGQLDVNGVYTLDEWIRNGYRESVLERVEE